MRALPLLAVLAAVGFAGPALAQSVALNGPDGQSAVLSASDPHVLMTVTHHSKNATFEGAPSGDVLAKVGAPLKDDGPFLIVVEDDLRPARSARMVETIEVIRLATPKPVRGEHKH